MKKNLGKKFKEHRRKALAAKPPQSSNDSTAATTAVRTLLVSPFVAKIRKGHSHDSAVLSYARDGNLRDTVRDVAMTEGCADQ